MRASFVRDCTSVEEGWVPRIIYLSPHSIYASSLLDTVKMNGTWYGHNGQCLMHMQGRTWWAKARVSKAHPWHKSDEVITRLYDARPLPEGRTHEWRIGDYEQRLIRTCVQTCATSTESAAVQAVLHCLRGFHTESGDAGIDRCCVCLRRRSKGLDLLYTL